MQDEAPGMVFWHDGGWKIYQAIEQYIRAKLMEDDYQEVNTPLLADRSLWEKSGHWEMFHEEMFVTESENRTYAIKPMNCPCHVQIFNQGLKSYRELPLRISEFGMCHRNEPSGSLHGLMRVRKFVQDDAHIFCTDDQVQSEAVNVIRFLKQVYADFGFNEIIVKLSTRPTKRLGSDELWDRAEGALAEALKSEGMAFEISPGQGAFYGPKIEFSFKDCLERVWQLGTLQIDYSMPGRLGANYIAEDGSKQVPVMLHRAILGSMERFIGILIEHYAGKLPTWLMPKQAMVMNITDNQADYAQKVVKFLKKQGIRAHLDLRNEKIGFKIREHSIQRIPYLLVVGDREVETGMVSVRRQDGSDMGSLTLEALKSTILADVSRLGRSCVEELSN
jgi:threonyl-tRNA synthetase